MEYVNDPVSVGKYFHYNTLTTSGARQAMGVAKKARQEDTLSKIQMPVLMIHAKGDGVASFTASQQAFQKMGSSNKEFITLDNSNHMVFWITNGRWLNSASLIFCWPRNRKKESKGLLTLPFFLR